ncbi:MAG: chromosome segregation protein SMC [Planctomyces sp.]|nr:chromosome segregation protein SMC [Planctomyces sp.]
MLKSLELFGFKSFAERTVFEFAAGITCVVGPNGSGKSNVVDSIKWILGDQSAKSLRGKEMSDVIFNGSSQRKPSQFAEASLTFDNARGILPIDAAEVRIGRRLYRSGDSEYLLNGAVVRLKDVRDLLLGTGAGAAAYSIIEQGRVDQILQSNPASRRQVFEEAAGISRFKSKRIDAERRLERVSQNLLRLTDIVDEIETQLNATRSQASKAAKYRELSQELRQLWTGLAADDSQRLDDEQADVDARLAELRTRAEDLETQLGAIEAGRRTIEAELTDCEAGIRELDQQAAGWRQSIAASNATIGHQSQRCAELNDEIEQVRRQQAGLAADAALAERELGDAADRLARLEASITERRGAFEEREALAGDVQRNLAAARDDLQGRRARREQSLKRLADDRRRLDALRSQFEISRASIGELDDRRAQFGERADVSARKLAEAAARLSELDAQAADARTRLDARLQERARLAAQLAELERCLNQRREQRSTWHARWLILQEWEANQTGIGIGVREILERAADCSTPPWNSVLGVAGSLLDVPLEYAPLIDLALGQRSQAIVVEDLAPWLAHWRKAENVAAGRLVLISLGTAPPADDAGFEALLRSLPGVVARADEVLADSELAPGLARRLLGDVWIVNDLGVAETFLRAAAGRCDCVTLQGEFLERDGRLTLGVSSGESAVVSRRSELRQLTLDLRRLDRQIDAETRQLAELTAQQHAREAAVADADAAVRERLELSTAARAQHDVQVQEHGRIVEQVQGLEDQWAAAVARDQELSAQAGALQADVESLEQELAAFDADVAGLQTEIDSVDGELRSLLSELDRERLELAKQEERLHALRETHDRLQRDQVVRQRQRTEAESRLQVLLEGLERSQLAVLQASADVAALTLQVETLQSELAGLEEQRGGVRVRRKQLLSEEDACRRDRHRIGDGIHSAEMQLREIVQQRATLEARMQEEYQLSLADVRASGASAYRDYLTSRGQQPLESSTEVEARDSTAANPASAAPEWATGLAPAFAEVRDELESQVERLRRRIKALGHVNTEALNDLDELETRYADLAGQLHDLQEARTALEDIIRRINVESRKLFLETFESIRTHFRELFRKLFGGGEGEIVLENPDDVLECGIDIVARPPGKELRSISLLSGGEKTLTAVALLFAMFKSKPSPYCILDEVDAALDEANVERYASIVRDFVSMTQFVIITHRKRTMTAADAIYGVTMEQAGISKRMSVRFEEVGEHGEILSPAQSRAA